MTDVVDRRTRSRMMAGIRGKNTKPELIVRSYLHRRGLRFRLHRKGLPGHPDIVLPKYCSVVFVHGCFWHRHPRCRFSYMPRTNQEFWSTKFSDNKKRDRRNRQALEALGWRVYVIWSCSTDEVSLADLVRRITCEELEGHPSA